MDNTKTIYCLFSIAHLPDQPAHNLVAWWSTKPSFDAIALAMGAENGFPCKVDKETVAIVNIWQGKYASFQGSDYKLTQVQESTPLWPIYKETCS